MFLIFNLMVSFAAAMIFLYAYFSDLIPAFLPVEQLSGEKSISKYLVFAIASIGIPVLNILSIVYFIFLVRRKDK